MYEYTDACPDCGNEDYDITDYGDEFDDYGGEQWWECHCEKCGCNFTKHRFYTTEKVIIEKGE